jgi:regulator of cell morphogenesis and NO signaling
MNYTLFSGNTKMVDLLLTNSRLLYVFPYFDIELGFGEATVKQMCREKNISVSLLLLVCNMYTFDDYAPSGKELQQIPIDGFLCYLRRSHKDYLEVRLPLVINGILNLISDCRIKNGEMLASFCEKYREEVMTHFKYEEEIVFPYIVELLHGKTTKDYKIGDYETNHSDIDAALEDLKNILIKYLPKSCTIEKCRDTLLNLFMFEHDLRKHTLLEDKILVSLVEHIEQSQ